jgi:hypothetical protein
MTEQCAQVEELKFTIPKDGKPSDHVMNLLEMISLAASLIYEKSYVGKLPNKIFLGPDLINLLFYCDSYTSNKLGGLLIPPDDGTEMGILAISHGIKLIVEYASRPSMCIVAYNGPTSYSQVPIIVTYEQ